MISKYVRMLRGKTSSSPTEIDTNTRPNLSEPEANDTSTFGPETLGTIRCDRCKREWPCHFTEWLQGKTVHERCGGDLEWNR